MTFKKKHIPWNKGKKTSEETIKKQSEARKGKPSPMKGKKHTEKSNRKNSESHKGRIPWNKGKKTGISPGNKGKKASEETNQRSSESHKGQSSPMKGKQHTIEANRKNAESHKGKTPWNKGKPSPLRGRSISDKSKRKQSATRQGIPYDEWETFACEKKYCPKFDEACRESCRAKYNYRCFMCGKPQSKNTTKTGKVRKLSVHHVDMDKAQGCESNWKLVPLCMKCHPVTHNDKMIARLGYLIKEK